MQVKSIDHIHIYSADPASSRAFWERHFGAAKVFETRNAHDQAVHILNLGGQNLALSEFPPGQTPAAPVVGDREGRDGQGFGGVMHLGINVADVASAVGELREAGVKVHSDPAEAHGTIFAYVEAPDGVLIELTQY